MGDEDGEVEESYEEEERMGMTVHQKLMATIIDEGDVVLEGHKRSVDEHIALVKEEMKLIKYMEAEESDPEVYAKETIKLLARKRQLMDAMDAKLRQFLSHLEEEDALANTMSPQK